MIDTSSKNYLDVVNNTNQSEEREYGRLKINSKNFQDVLRGTNQPALTESGEMTPLSGWYYNDAPGNALARINEQAYQNYFRNYSPFVNDMIADLNSTELVDQAKAESGQLLARTKDQQNRNLSRGVTTLTPAQKALLERTNQLSSTSQDNANVNNARVAQDDINYQNMMDLMGIATTNRQMATQGLAEGTGLSSQRDQAYRQGKAQARQTNTSLAVTAALIMMGV